MRADRADDAKLLASMGFNLIRLGVMWPGVNPESMDQVRFWPRFSVPFSLNFSMSRWQVNMTYIDEIKKLIAIGARRVGFHRAGAARGGRRRRGPDGLAAAVRSPSRRRTGAQVLRFRFK